MKRRNFLQKTAISGAGIVSLQTPLLASRQEKKGSGFKLKYAPHFGMFKNHAPGGFEDELQFMYDNGFTALEDNGMPTRSVADQEKIVKKMQSLNMEMGVFVAHASWKTAPFAGTDQSQKDKVLKDIKNAVEVAKRVNAKWVTVVPGQVERKLEEDYQLANCIDLLKRCCEVLEPHGIVMVLEPLNWWTNHPGVLLSKIPQANLICEAVGSPSCKILNDLYHQQITEGNLIPNIDLAWEQIAYFQVGDNPGRNEPTTGEINYRNIFKHIHNKGYTGIVGMEHGNSMDGKAGEMALIEAYQQSDDF